MSTDYLLLFAIYYLYIIVFNFQTLHDHQIIYGTQARNWKRQIERAMVGNFIIVKKYNEKLLLNFAYAYQFSIFLIQNNLVNIQKKFSSAPDFARHGAYFASISGNSSCQPPLVKGADTEEEKNSSRTNYNNYIL